MNRNKEKIIVAVLAVIFIGVVIGAFWDLYGRNLFCNCENESQSTLTSQNAATTVNKEVTKSSISTQSSTLNQSSQILTNSTSSNFTLTSDAGVNNGSMPVEYTCDGVGSSPALAWTNAPAGTKEFALMMTTIPVDGGTKWNWVLYGIPASTTSLAKNNTTVGTIGVGSNGSTLAYAPPCSQGPGDKTYTFTIYALSASPTLPSSPDQVTGEVLTKAISSITLGSASLNFSYARQE